MSALADVSQLSLKHRIWLLDSSILSHSCSSLRCMRGLCRIWFLVDGFLGIWFWVEGFFRRSIQNMVFGRWIFQTTVFCSGFSALGFLGTGFFGSSAHGVFYRLSASGLDVEKHFIMLIYE